MESFANTISKLNNQWRTNLAINEDRDGMMYSENRMPKTKTFHKFNFSASLVECSFEVLLISYLMPADTGFLQNHNF